MVPLILYRATITLLLLVREKEKEPPILTFLNLYVTLHEIHGKIWWLNSVSLASSCNLSFFLLDFDFLEKTSFSETFLFFLTSIFGQICLQTRLIYNLRFPKFVCRPNWFTIWDFQNLSADETDLQLQFLKLE